MAFLFQSTVSSPNLAVITGWKAIVMGWLPCAITTPQGEHLIRFCLVKTYTELVRLYGPVA